MVNFVEAIEEGRIVKVSEDYAKREGLLIVRKQDDNSTYGGNQVKSTSFVNKEKSPQRSARLVPSFTMEKMRKPLEYYRNDVASDLVSNFHWEIKNARRLKNITRRQLASKVGESEETIKMVENGMLPRDNYILINKIQSALGLQLRKEAKKYEVPKLDRTISAARSTPSWMKDDERPFVSDKKVEIDEDSESGEIEELKDEDLSGEDIEVSEEDD